mgnify:CR=1 FL=1
MTSSAFSPPPSINAPSRGLANHVTPPPFLQQGFDEIDHGVAEEMKMNDIKLNHCTGSVRDDLGANYIKDDYFVKQGKDIDRLLTPTREPIKKSKSLDDATYSDRTKLGSLKPKRCMHCKKQFIDDVEDSFCSGECKWSWSSVVYDNRYTTSFSSSNSSLSFYDVNNAASFLDD